MTGSTSDLYRLNLGIIDLAVDLIQKYPTLKKINNKGTVSGIFSDLPCKR